MAEPQGGPAERLAVFRHPIIPMHVVRESFYLWAVRTEKVFII